MQGRLSPPVNGRVQAFPEQRWEDEFVLAKAASLHCIEWIIDASTSAPNPILTDEGVVRIDALTKRHEVSVRSVCADVLMDRPILRVADDERRQTVRMFNALLHRCDRAGIRHVVMPFVDQSAITTASEEDAVVRFVCDALSDTAGCAIELHLELSLPPKRVASLIGRLSDSRVKVNYDSGNSASLGYDPREEFGEYGHRLGSVHVKDRRRGGSTVPLGQGDADLPVVFALLRQAGYCGDLILQVARSTSGDELQWARQNRAIVAQLMAAE